MYRLTTYVDFEEGQKYLADHFVKSYKCYVVEINVKIQLICYRDNVMIAWDPVCFF